MSRGKPKRAPAVPAVGKGKRQPAVDVPGRKESPRTPDLPGAGNSDERLCWRFTHVDNDGDWGFRNVDPQTLCEIMTHLRDFESMTLNAVFHNGGEPGKDYEVEQIPNQDALKRLVEKNLADQTKISRLRLGGKPRLYGFLRGNVFYVVFWDPEHDIWPSNKKHT